MSRRFSIRSAARPFVARALRGPRGRRLLALSVLLTAMSGVLGGWLALGTGEVERELRAAFSLEENTFRQEQSRFVLIADSADEAAALHSELQRRAAGLVPGYDETAYRVQNMLDTAELRLRQAAVGEPPRELRGLQVEAVRTLETWTKSHVPSGSYRAGDYFAWYDADEVRALRSAVAREMTPGVEIYASPLGPLDALRMAGVFAGGALILLLLLAAPVLAGTQMAQETHENTLQPLAGSALRAQELAIGLTAGPLAVVGVLAALLGILGGIGVALAAEMSHRTAGTLALLPQAAASHSLAQAFGLGGEGPAFGAEIDTTVPVIVGALGMLTLAYLGLRALARRVGNTDVVTLRGGEALVGAIAAMVLVTTANPPLDEWRSEEFYLLNLGMLSIPLAILLMMRAPTGDVPPALRRTPVGPLVGEFMAWAALYLALAATMLPHGAMHVFGHPIAFLYALWFLVVTALLSLRVAVAPMTFASRLWTMVCMVMLAIAFGETAAWSRSAQNLYSSNPSVFALTELSPLLGFVQAALTIAVPWTLLRALRRPASVAPVTVE
jgi:hypothetical protein